MVLKVLLVTRIAAHYRQGVYGELFDHARHDWVIAADPGTIPVTRSELEGGIPVIPLEWFSEGRFIPLRNHWFGKLVWQSGVIAAIRRTRPDCVVFEGSAAIASTWLAAALCRMVGIRVAFWTTGWHRADAGIRRKLRLWFYLLGERLLLYGNNGANIGVQMGYPIDRMTVIKNSVSFRQYGLSQSEAETSQEVARVPISTGCFVGAVIRLNPAKNLGLIITAVAEARRLSGRELGVMLVGEGPDEPSLRQLSQKLGVPLLLPGPMYSQAALTRVYDLLCVTVIPEWAGLTTIQSMSYGCPVVTHGDFSAQSAEAEAVVPDVTGSFFTRGDASSAAREILRWATVSERERRATAAACRAEVASGWTPEAHARAIIDAIDGLVAAKSGPGS